MRNLLWALAALLPASAAADLYPAVTKGPTILGVGQTEAWIAWYTAHHQGEPSFLNECYNDALTGTPNDTIPTVTLAPANSAGHTSFQDRECSRFHRVKLTGLSPGRTYNVTLDKTRPDGSAVVAFFRTAPANGPAGPLKFLVFGDTRDEPLTSPSTRADHQALVDALLSREGGAAFAVHTGDFALNLPLVSGEDRGWAGYFEVANPLLATLPIFPVFGNHESIDPEYFERLLSAPSLAGAPHPTYFSFDWGPVHFAILDTFQGAPDPLKSGARKPLLDDAQAAWLDADLSAAKAAGKLLFLATHQGAFSHGADDKAHGGSPDVQAKVVPLMIEHGVLGIFAGHDHYYQRGREACVGYMVVGAGGAPMYEPDAAAPGVAVAKKAVSYLVVEVADGVARGTGKDTAGNVFDVYTFEPAGCEPQRPDAGAPSPDVGTDAALGPDAAGGRADAAQEPGEDAGEAGDAGQAGGEGNDAGIQEAALPETGCGCSTGSGPGLAALLVGALALVPRARRRQGGAGGAGRRR